MQSSADGSGVAAYWLLQNLMERLERRKILDKADFQEIFDTTLVVFEARSKSAPQDREVSAARRLLEQTPVPGSPRRQRKKGRKG